MKNMKVTLVEDARDCWKWSSVRWHLFWVGVVAAVGHLPDLLQHLPTILMFVQDNWPTLLPILERLFPTATQSDWIAIATLVGLALRVTTVQRRPADAKQ